MRKWHRWLSLVFGAVLLWIAVTGVLSQVVPMIQRGSLTGEAAAAAAAPPGFVCPETMTCRPRAGNGTLVRTLHHLHSGASLGATGIVIATLAGLAMVFFAGSGLWLYIMMWRNRRQRGVKPGWLWD